MSRSRDFDPELDSIRLPLRLASRQCEFDWIAMHAVGRGERGPRELAVLAWLSRTGPRRGASLSPSMLRLEDVLPGAPSWLRLPSAVALSSDDRPLLMIVVYDLDAPSLPLRALELPVEHAEFDASTLSASASDGAIALRHMSKEGRFTAAVSAKTEDFEIDLELRAEKAPVGFGPGGAFTLRQGPLSIAYAQRTRLSVSGTVCLRHESDWERVTELRGDACQDRQWLEVTATRLKWIWIHVRLDDGRELTGFVMRDSGAGRWASANDGRLLDRRAWLVERDGTVRALAGFELEAVTSKEVRTDRGTCPTEVAVDVPELDLRFTLRHVVPTPFVAMKAFGPLLDAGIWEGPARIDVESGAARGHAWLEIMNAATAKLADFRGASRGRKG